MKKRSIRLLLSALLVLAMAFQSIAAPLSSMNPAAALEPAKITGTWSTDASGSWRFNAPDGAAKDGWYYLNTTNNATDYNWFCFDANGVMRTGWVQDKNDPSVWYYTGESKGSSEGGLVKGWITDPQDGKKYYLDPSTGIMCHGWKQISGVWYYFGESRYADRRWAPDTTGYWKAGASGKHSYGSLYMNEWTPDGYYVGANGAWVQNHSEDDNSDKPDPVPEYSITVENDGNGTASASAQKSAAGKEITLTAAPNEGYRFKEWNVVSGGVTVTENKFTMPANNVTVKAVFENKEVPVTSVSLDKTEVTIEVGDEDVKLSAIVLPENATDKSVNWSSSKESVATVDSEGNVTAVSTGTATITVTTVDGNKTATCAVKVAAPAPETYTVTFDLNGATGTAPTTQKIKDGEKVTKPADPTADGYTFGGWYKEATCTNAWDFANDTVTANTTLYAKWKPEDEGSYILKAQGNWFKAFSETTTDKTKITDIIFCKKLPQGVSAENPVNLTDDSENGKVKGYIVKNGENYKIYIVGDYIFGNSVCYNMFSGFSNLKTLDFGNFDTSNVTIMFNMFSGCSALKSLDLSSFDTSETSNMQSMFSGCSKLESITFGTGFKTSKVTSMTSMFNGCSALKSLDLSSFITSEVTQMGSMFKDCSTLESLDLSKFNTKIVTDMPSMFNGCSGLTSLNLSSFDTSAVKDMNGMFTGCSKLESITFGTNFNTSKVTAMNAMFSGCSALESLDLSRFDTSAVTNMDAMFTNCSALTSLNLSSFGTSKVTKMSNMFNGCSTLERLDISNFTVGDETTVEYMFKDCSKLTSVKIISDKNEKIKDALGGGWAYDGDTKAYVKSSSLLKASGTSSDPVNDAPMAETEVSEPTAEVFEPEFEPEKFEEAKPEELIEPAEAVAEEAAP
ncbi:MAG: BspA family leucine-rich repeat surface protein [Eubacteriales bacterium]|nr:BspA family leucine-rich repeat surface protein [Eubacteriales bacterium]